MTHETSEIREFIDMIFERHISNFEPEPYDAKIQIPIVIRPAGEAYEASFFDANIHASGDTEEEALRNLKALILDVFDDLSSLKPEEMGPEPARQHRVLNHYIRPVAM